MDSEKIMIILFDVDGVLIKAFEFGKWLKKNHSLTDYDLNEFFSGPFLKCSEGKSDLLNELSPFIKKWELNYTAEELCQIWFKYDGLRIKSGHALLNDCKNNDVKIGVATTQENYRKQYIIDNYPEIKSLDYHFFSCDLGFAKPRYEFFDEISRFLKTKDILFIDDSKQNVEASINYGWKGIHYINQTCLSEIINSKM